MKMPGISIIIFAVVEAVRPATNVPHRLVHAYGWLHIPFVLGLVIVGYFVTFIRLLFRASSWLSKGVA